MAFLFCGTGPGYSPVGAIETRLAPADLTRKGPRSHGQSTVRTAFAARSFLDLIPGGRIVWGENRPCPTAPEHDERAREGTFSFADQQSQVTRQQPGRRLINRNHPSR